MHIFITGGRGFVGSALTEFFLKKKYKITILSRELSDLSGVRIINSTEEISPDETIDVIGQTFEDHRSKEGSIIYSSHQESEINVSEEVLL